MSAAHQPDLDIEALRKAAEAATPGPWKLYKAPLRPQFPVMIHEIQKDGSEPIVNWGGFDGLQRAKSKITADARYIAAANPAAILALLDERLALLDRLERAEADAKHYSMGADAEAKSADEWRERALRAEAAAAVLAAAPPAQGLPAAPEDPMDWRLPCDVKVGAGTHKKGTTLRSLVSRMEMLHGMAMKAHPVDEAKAAEFRAFLDQQFGSSPPAAAPSEPVAWHPALKAAADVVMALPLREGFDNDACKAMAITANAAILNLATPPAQDAGTGVLAQIRAAVAKMAQGYEYGAGYYNQEIFINGLREAFDLCDITIKEDWES